MIFKSQVLASASGSIGGLTASHGRSGMYFRARAIPTNPNSTAQQLVRGNMGTLSSEWNQLTQDQRDGWALYASNVTVQNKLGDPINLSGQQMFLRTNCVWRYVRGASLQDAPTTFNLGTFTPPTLTTVTGGNLIVGFNESDEWVDEDLAVMVIYGGRPQNAGVNFFKGPFRLAGIIEGDNAVPPTAPATIATPFVVTVGQKEWVRAQVLRADGRLSMSVIVGPTLGS